MNISIRISDIARRLLALLIAALLIPCAAFAETVRGDLDERFADRTIEYEGVSYRKKNRMETILFMVADSPDGGDSRADFLLLLAVDEDEKRVTPVRVDPDMVIALPDGTETLLGDIYAQGADADESGTLMLDAVNALYTEDLAEHYMSVGWAELSAFLGGEYGFGEAARLLVTFIAADPEGLVSAAKLLFGSDGIVKSDMKSGRMMNLLDKFAKYEIAAPRETPEDVTENEDGTRRALPGSDIYPGSVLDIYYDPVVQ